MRHDNTAYQNGCRCDICRAAHTLYMNRYRWMREKNGGHTTENGIIGGHLFMPIGRTQKQVKDLRRCLTVKKIAAFAGISTRTVRELHLGLRRRVHPRVATRIDALWADYCGPTERATLLSMAPLLAVIDRKWPLEDRKAGIITAPPLSETDRRYLYRSDTLDSARADRICADLGLLPEDVWGMEWFGVEEQSA